MTYGQSLARKAIHARKWMGARSWGDEYDTYASSGTAATTEDIKTIDFSQAAVVGSGTQLPGFFIIQSSGAEAHDVLSIGSDGITGYWANIASTYSKAGIESADIKFVDIPRLGKSDLFRELQKHRADQTRFREQLSRLYSLTNVRERGSIAGRIDELLGDFQSDYGRSLNTESLQTFIELLSLNPGLKRPVITALDNGNLLAEWRSEDKSHYLGAQMLATHQVRFVAIRPDVKRPHLRIHSSGVTSVDELISDLASYNILSWASTS